MSNASDGRAGRGRQVPAASGLVAAVAAELERRLAEPLAPALYLVATPIGNLGDITLRALAVLAEADHVYCEDTRHSRTLFAHFAIDRPLRPYHDHNAEAERPRILAELAAGRSVALVSDAGTPLVSDPGFKLVRACLDAGHGVTALPGASAVIAALSVAGLPTDAFHFAGFLPVREGQRRARLAELVTIPATLVLFEAPNRLAASLADLAETLGADRQVAVARELTKRFEEVRRGSATALAAWAAAEPARGEVVILVAPPIAVDASDADIEAAFSGLDPALGLKEASRTIATRLGVPRSRAYAIGLRLKGPQP
jgi:16S rRNA (cytidine1402-2'-O)-methyltransferase